MSSVIANPSTGGGISTSEVNNSGAATPQTSTVVSSAAAANGNSADKLQSLQSKKPNKKTPAAMSFIKRLAKENGMYQDELIQLLMLGNPRSLFHYSEHLYKLLNIVHEHKFITKAQVLKIKSKLLELFDKLPVYQAQTKFNSKLYIIVEKNFDILLKVALQGHNLELSSRSIKFLTEVVYLLNYWEIYNLLNWNPAIYNFIVMINLDLHERYLQFIQDYPQYSYTQETVAFDRNNVGKNKGRLADKLHEEYGSSEDEMDVDDDDDDANSQGRRSGLVVQRIGQTSQLVNADGETIDEENDDQFINSNADNLAPRERKRITIEPKLARKIIKRANTRISAKSSNYDPDVVHECQLPSADEAGQPCLRRFSRKYELIRHQETVHSKKKKLFKCFVCVKQNPGSGPRIFTRHDTLAKHIRVNHKISGKDAKAEVAYSKRHAEIVEEGDITVHVGRRKTKVDFELRAHMERRRSSKGGDDNDDSRYYDGEYSYDADGNLLDEEDLDEDEEIVVYNKHRGDVSMTPETDNSTIGTSDVVHTQEKDASSLPYQVSKEKDIQQLPQAPTLSPILSRPAPPLIHQTMEQHIQSTLPRPSPQLPVHHFIQQSINRPLPGSSQQPNEDAQRRSNS